MKLYYMQGACSLAPHIVLNWIGKPFELNKVEHSKIHGPEYMKVNPLGKVPALIDDQGHTLIEASAILKYLSDKFPEANLGPGASAEDKAEMNRWLSHLSGNLHPAFYPFFMPYRYIEDPAQHKAVKEAAAKQIRKQFAFLDNEMKGKNWVLAGRRTIVDAYLYVMLRWAQYLPGGLEEFPNLERFAKKMHEDPGVRRSLEEEGLT